MTNKYINIKENQVNSKYKTKNNIHVNRIKIRRNIKKLIGTSNLVWTFNINYNIEYKNALRVNI